MDGDENGSEFAPNPESVPLGIEAERRAGGGDSDWK